MGTFYSDVKMVGIVLSINDRVNKTTGAQYYSELKSLLIEYVDFYLGKGITPFMITAQAVHQHGNNGSSLILVFSKFGF